MILKIAGKLLPTLLQSMLGRSKFRHQVPQSVTGLHGLLGSEGGRLSGREAFRKGGGCHRYLRVPKYGMRKFIDIIREAKLVDGYWSATTARDLQSLVAQHGDLRGVATEKEIFLGRAGHDVHHSIRAALGLMPLYGYDGNDDQHGFDFYAAPIEAHYEHEAGADDPYEGRDDWNVQSPPAFVVGQVAIWVSEKDHCLRNPQFARMVGKTSVS